MGSPRARGWWPRLLSQAELCASPVTPSALTAEGHKCARISLSSLPSWRWARSTAGSSARPGHVGHGPFPPLGAVTGPQQPQASPNQREVTAFKMAAAARVVGLAGSQRGAHPRARLCPTHLPDHRSHRAAIAPHSTRVSPGWSPCPPDTLAGPPAMPREDASITHPHPQRHPAASSAHPSPQTPFIHRNDQRCP